MKSNIGCGQSKKAPLLLGVQYIVNKDFPLYLASDRQGMEMSVHVLPPIGRTLGAALIAVTLP